jgi:hypothetical protein
LILLPASTLSFQPDGYSERLTAFVRGVANTAGIEKSVKASAGGVDSDRLLLSWASDGSENDNLLNLFDELALPCEAQDEIVAEIPDGAFFHLGYEGAAAPRVKFYCEYKSAVAASRTTLYTAWKWHPKVPGVVSVDEYREHRVESQQAAEDIILLTFGGKAGRIEQGLLTVFKQCVAGGEIPLLLDVRRRGGGRNSLDLRCYGSQLRVHNISALITSADLELDCKGQLAQALGYHADAELGHIAGGIDDYGAPFLTIYFGARSLS